MTVSVVPTKLAERQIAELRGRPHASFLLAVDDIRRRGCAAAGVRLTGSKLSAICRLDLYGAWRLLAVFEAADQCVVLMVAEHTRTENPYYMIYRALEISEPAGPRTKPACCDTDGTPPVDVDLAARLGSGLDELARGLRRSGPRGSRR